ncbi:MAG: helix-turn-helix domain-containing protein [Phyllobacterium sp.]
MTFQPRMKTSIEGVSVVGELRWRAWQGVVADVWTVECAPRASGEYISEDPRLFVLLDSVGWGKFNLWRNPHQKPVTRSGTVRTMSYIPAGMPIWGQVQDIEHLRHLDLHIDVKTMERRFRDDLVSENLLEPRLMFYDEKMMALARLIAAECLNDNPLHDLYGDGLTTALFVELFAIGRTKPRSRSQLTPLQLRRAISYIEDNCTRNIRLQELADLTDRSQSYFSHAFKASTGIPPHQWQMEARIQRAQQLLVAPNPSLTRIATDTGFSDQAHFSRVFKRMTGVTPAAWHREKTG